MYSKIKLKITSTAYQKLHYYTELCDTEISGFGKVRENRDCLEIYDIEIFDQNVSSAHTTLDADELAKFLNKKVQEKQNIKDYKVWWHSHRDMEAYFSIRDDITINNSTEFPYLISLVTNKNSEVNARLDIYKPLRITIPLTLEVLIDNNEKIKKLCQNEIKMKVIKRFPRSIIKDRKKSLIPEFSKNRLQLPGLGISDLKQ